MKRPTPKLIKGKPSTPWMVRIPKAFVLPDENGKKRDLRKFFASKPDAIDYIKRLLNPAIGYVKADWREHAAENGKISLQQAIQDFLTLRYRPDETVNNRTLVQERQILSSFTARYRTSSLDSFTHREIDSWLRSMEKAPQTIANHFAVVRRFFNWCDKEELLTGRNPIVRAEKPKVPYCFPTTIAPAEMGKFLVSVNELIAEQPEQPWREILAYLCIGGFAGLRTSEIKRLRWEDINWHPDNGHVTVLKSKMGSPRSVTIVPALRRHLEPFALQSGRVFSVSFQKEAELRAELGNRAGIKLPHNCLRHSFATYHIATWRNWEDTAFEMGHTSPRVTRSKYVVVKDKAVGEQWWAL